ncbi:MAG: 6-phosphofructokinase [Bacteroidia bacterium]|nr:6-phosphofructokinase [Bacteroidia bacterium]
MASGYLDKLRVIGLKNGFKSFENETDKVLLYPNKQLMGEGIQNAIITSEMINVGGSMIGTSRYEKLEIGDDSRMSELKEIIHSLKRQRINMLYIIGGEGSMKAAHALATIYEKKFPQNDHWRFNIVGIPKTMDNDILWVWQTFGFMSAVEKAREFIDYLAVETSSNPRVGIVQLFGSNSGFVVSHAVLASRTGVCDFALIPESPYKLSKLIPALKDALEKKKKNYGLIIMSETAIPDDAVDYLKKYEDEICLTKLESKALDKYFNIDNRNIKGHIDDKLRDASFKIVKFSLEKEIDFRVLTNEPRHLIRAIPPSTIDIINASRLGTLAVDNAIAGYTDFMVSQWLTEYCLVPLDLVVLGRKRIPKDGIFWKSVIAKTGQPEKLD